MGNRMKHGNWIPISKAFILDMPHNRPYTRLEAAYSLQYDYDQKKSVTVAGYSALWSWSRSRVSKFLTDMNVEIIYPETTKKRRNQKGHIALHKKDIIETYNKHIRCIENTYLQEQKDIKKTKREHKKDISPCSTKEPNIFPEEIKNFSDTFQAHVLKTHSNKAPKITDSLLNKCNDTIDKLIRLDNFKLDYIIEVLRWAVKDDFWSGQLFSLASLRRKSNNDLTKFQNIANAYDNSLPEKPKEKIYVC